ncbi:MAG: SEC-C metal-binding domain-containing protein [Anaeromyxobacteraceae bacterium]
MLVSRVDVCTQPGCTCREVTLEAVELELSRPPEDYEMFRRLLDDGEKKVAMVDLDLGLVGPLLATDPRPALSDEWLAYLRTRMDGDLLDCLHERWIRAKGLQSPRGWKTIDWSKRDPDEMVFWEEMFPDDRVDHFLYEDKRVFFASEHYCRKPACPCSQVRLVFMEMKDSGKFRQIGSILVGLPGGEAREFDSSRRDAELLKYLWAAFQRRYLVAVHLGERDRRIKQIGAMLPRSQPPGPAPQAAVAVPRVGRNDPCPCGSGKKFKRCCGR